MSVNNAVIVTYLRDTLMSMATKDSGLKKEEISSIKLKNMVEEGEWLGVQATFITYKRGKK